MVFDSAPGVATYSRIVDAMTVGLPAIPLLRQLLACLVHFLVALIWMHSYFSGGANLVQRARMDLIDMKLIKSNRGRLYLYSTGDRMVGWEDVESHALEAERSRERVKMEKWGGTPHVGHMANDGNRYWGAIESFWLRALLISHSIRSSGSADVLPFPCESIFQGWRAFQLSSSEPETT